MTLGLRMRVRERSLAGEAGWRPLRIGGGGYVIQMDIAPDGEKVVGCDTYGAYRWNSTSTQWDQLITATSMGMATYLSLFGVLGLGAYAIAIAPSNTQRYYMVWSGYIWRTDNRGASWTQTAFARDTTLDSNGTVDRIAGQKLAVDPNDPDTCYFGRHSQGVWVTHDAGASWAVIPTGTIPFGGFAGDQSEPGHSGICFDPDSGTNGSGYTNTIYVPSYTNGVWRTTNGGSSWSQLTSGPTNVWHAQVAADGIYYCAESIDDGDGACWKYASGAWTSLGKNGNAIACDPNDAARIVIAGSGCWNMYESLNRGSTWVGTWGWNYPGSGDDPRTATDIPWLAWTQEATWMSLGDLRFDGSDAVGGSMLFFAQGIGVWKSRFPTTYVEMGWTSQTKGIEQLWTTGLWSVPGGALFTHSWDRPVFRVTDPEVFPTTHCINRDHAIVHGYSVEHARNNPSVIVALCNSTNGEESSYSTDGGVTWSAIPSKPATAALLQCGHIAARTDQNWVWSPGGGKASYYTTNAGTSWTACGSPANGWSHGAVYVNRHVLCTDGTYFYLMLINTAMARSADGGATWSTMSTPAWNNSMYHSKLRAVPIIAGVQEATGHLFWCDGPVGDGDHAGPDTNYIFRRSTDGGATWSNVQAGGVNIYEVYDFGFGKEKPGGSYPTIFIAGYVNSVFGVYMSDDNCSTWTRLGTTGYPLDWVDKIIACTGDMNIYGQCYAAFQGAGFAYYKP